MPIEELLRAIDAEYRRLGASQMQEPHNRFEPATEAELSAFEARLGQRLPEDLRTFLATNDVEHPFDGGFACLDLEAIVSTWATMTKLLDQGVFDDGRVAATEPAGNWDNARLKKVWWSRGWVPVSEDGCGNLYCVDLDPGSGGVVGQMMNMEIQDGQGPFATEHPSFTSYLREHLRLLEAGKVVVEDGHLDVDRYA